MRKSLTILLFSFFVCLNLISDVAAQITDDEKKGVARVELDKNEAVTICADKKGRVIGGGCNQDSPKVKVLTIARDTEMNSLEYYYLVTGGKIIGQGANVVWDFAAAKPGTYSILVGVGKDGVLKGQTITKTVSYRDCPDCDVFYCECPTSISVSGPAKPAQRGDSVIFKAEVKGGEEEITIKYNWVVSDGEIVWGQGTSQVLVKSSRNMKIKTIKAEVVASGFCPECPEKKGSASVEVTNN